MGDVADDREVNGEGDIWVLPEQVNGLGRTGPRDRHEQAATRGAPRFLTATAHAVFWQSTLT
jgi:hypothetical protein